MGSGAPRRLAESSWWEDDRELGSGPLPPEIEAFVDREFAEARAILPEQTQRLSPDAKEAAEELFRATVARLTSTQRPAGARMTP